jgi:hypothetical protein
MAFVETNGIQNPNIPEFDFKNPNSYLWTLGQFKQIDAQVNATPPPQDDVRKEQTENGTRDAGKTFRPLGGSNTNMILLVGGGLLGIGVLFAVLK